MRHGILVAGGNADNDTRLIEFLINVAEFAFEFVIIHETARCTDGHVNCIYAEQEAVFERCHVDTGVGTAGTVCKDLHEDKLCCGCCAGELDGAVRIENKARDRAGDVRTVSVVVRNIIVTVIVVIRERDFVGNVFAGNGGLNGSNVLFGECRILEKTIVLERFVSEVQARIQNRNDHAIALILDVLHCSCAGNQVCIHLGGFLNDRCIVRVRHIYSADTAHLFNLSNVLISSDDGHTVDQSGVVVQALCFER